MNPTPEGSSSPDPVGVQEEQSYLLVLPRAWPRPAWRAGVYLLDTRTDDFHIMGWARELRVARRRPPSSAWWRPAVTGWARGSADQDHSPAALAGVDPQLASLFRRPIHRVQESGVGSPEREPVGFFEYYDVVARSFAWKNAMANRDPLGVWGYFFRGLEILELSARRFARAFDIAKRAPYCQACQRYMRTRQLALVPASVPAKKVKKADVAGRPRRRRSSSRLLRAASERSNLLQQLAAGNKSHTIS